jgi:hypothetical protein
MLVLRREMRMALLTSEGGAFSKKCEKMFDERLADTVRKRHIWIIPEITLGM